MKTILTLLTITGLASCTPGVTYGVAYTFEGSDGKERTVEVARTTQAETPVKVNQESTK